MDQMVTAPIFASFVVKHHKGDLPFCINAEMMKPFGAIL